VLPGMLSARHKGATVVRHIVPPDTWARTRCALYPDTRDIRTVPSAMPWHDAER